MFVWLERDGETRMARKETKEVLTKLNNLFEQYPNARIVTDVGASLGSGWGDLIDVKVYYLEDKNERVLELIFD